MSEQATQYVEEVRARERLRKLPMNPALQFLALPGVRALIAQAFDDGAAAAQQQHEQRQAAKATKREQNT